MDGRLWALWPQIFSEVHGLWVERSSQRTICARHAARTAAPRFQKLFAGFSG